MNNPKIISKNSGGKLLELDRCIQKSHEKKSDVFGFNQENCEPSQEIPEINLEDLNVLKTNSMISHDSALDKVKKNDLGLSF